MTDKGKLTFIGRGETKFSIEGDVDLGVVARNLARLSLESVVEAFGDFGADFRVEETETGQRIIFYKKPEGPREIAAELIRDGNTFRIKYNRNSESYWGGVILTCITRLSLRNDSYDILVGE